MRTFSATNLILYEHLTLRTFAVTTFLPYEHYPIQTSAYEYLLTNLFLYEPYVYELWSWKLKSQWGPFVDDGAP